MVIGHGPEVNVKVFTSRCDVYSMNRGNHSNWKALLLNQVVAGKSRRLVDGTNHDPSLAGPPPGYDSVGFFFRACFKSY